MKVLNLDALANPNRTLTLNGKTHEVLDMTVENFIETTKSAEKLKDAPAHEQMEATVEMIVRYAPSLSAKELKRLSLVKLNTILSFIRGELDEDKKASSEGQKGDSGKQ